MSSQKHYLLEEPLIFIQPTSLPHRQLFALSSFLSHPMRLLLYRLCSDSTPEHVWSRKQFVHFHVQELLCTWLGFQRGAYMCDTNQLAFCSSSGLSSVVFKVLCWEWCGGLTNVVRVAFLLQVLELETRLVLFRNALNRIQAEEHRFNLTAKIFSSLTQSTDSA